MILLVIGSFVYTGLSTGDVAAITVSVLFSVFLVALIVLVLLGFINITPLEKCRGKENSEIHYICLYRMTANYNWVFVLSITMYVFLCL